MKRPSPVEAWKALVQAAAPYGLLVEQTAFSDLPELVLLRPSDGLEVGRLRYYEPEGGPPIMRTIFPHEVTYAEQAEVEAHFRASLGPTVARVYSPALWVSFLTVPGAETGPGAST